MMDLYGQVCVCVSVLVTYTICMCVEYECMHVFIDPCMHLCLYV